MSVRAHVRARVCVRARARARARSLMATLPGGRGAAPPRMGANSLSVCMHAFMHACSLQQTCSHACGVLWEGREGLPSSTEKRDENLTNKVRSLSKFACGCLALCAHSPCTVVCARRTRPSRSEQFLRSALNNGRRAYIFGLGGPHGSSSRRPSGTGHHVDMDDIRSCGDSWWLYMFRFVH